MIDKQEDQEKPPVLKNWSQVYVLVLAIHLVVILLFLLFKMAFQAN